MRRSITSRWLDYPEDCIRLCKVALDHHFFITPLEAQVIWTEVSDSYSAGWLMVDMHSEQEIWDRIKPYLGNLY